MCTVSFAPTESGFALAMNRDEKRTRAAGLPPTIAQRGDRRVVFPREPTGGAWIAVNDIGICLALINWHRVQAEPGGQVVSRGEVINRLIHASSPDEITEAISRLPLEQLRPFRLIAIAPQQQDLTEWQWNEVELEPRMQPWAPRHWFSSGFDEARAEIERQVVCNAAEQANPANISFLRQLHRSHAPERGPFSICMHRPDAKTVSYTEVIAENHSVIMLYQPGSPCAAAPVDEAVLPISRSFRNAVRPRTALG